MKRLTGFFKNGWIIGIGTALITWFITDVLFKQKFLSRSWHFVIRELTNKVYLSIGIILAIISGGILLIFLFIKIRKHFFDNDKNSKIGEYSFKQLERILRSEHISKSDSALIRNDYSQFSLLEIFITWHSRLAAGINIESDLFLYHDVCPRLHLFGLMDREDQKFESPDLITHHYTIIENGKKFWAILNKLSIKHRLEYERQKTGKK
jgi:hypothetical protein